MGVAPDAKVLYFMNGPSRSDGTILPCRTEGGKEFAGDIMADYIISAVDMGAQIISVSRGVGFSVELNEALAYAQHKGVVILGALPNSFADSLINIGWPAGANGVVAVQRMDTNAVVPLVGQSNYDRRVIVAAPGVGVLLQGSVKDGSWETQTLGGGTSNATPIVASFLALVKQKYPNATGNQLIQTLIHNTGGKDHPLDFSIEDGLGYGVASATHMLKVDPTQYPDLNPLVRSGRGYDPSPELIANPPGINTPSPSATDPGSEPGTVTAGSWLVPVVLGGIVTLLLVIGLIVLLVVRSTRAAKHPPTAGEG